MTHRINYLMTVFFCMLLTASCSSPGALSRAGDTGTKAVRNIDFLNSLGVNSAVSRRGESLEKTMKIVRYLGIRWIRSGYEGGLPVDDLISLHKTTGVRFSYGLLSGGNDTARLLAGARTLAVAGALLAIEGANEPNNWAIVYNGEKGGKNASWLPVARLQHDLYRAVKKDPLLKKYPVWSITENGAETDNVGLQFLKIPDSAGTLMPAGTVYADFANCHNYFMHPSHPGLYDNQAWNASDPTRLCKVDGLYGNYGRTWRFHYPGYAKEALVSLPRVTTETGAVINGTLTEEKQACLYLDLYLDQFKRGWSYTAVYLLRDRSDESGNQQFGFYKPDYTPRKAAVYLHNLTTILADEGGAGKIPGRLEYTIPGKPATVHDLLLQNSNGTFDLVIWNEKVTGSDKVSLHFGEMAKEVNVYDPTTGTTAVRTWRHVRSIPLILSDHPVVVEL